MKKYAKYFPLLPALLALLIYANSVGNKYTQDDAIVIYENKLVKQGLSGWGDILNKDTFYGFFQKEGKDKLVAGGRYRPLTLLQFSMGWQIFGDNVFLFHLINILWYAFLGWITYLVLFELLGLKFSREKSQLIALLATLLYVSHPVHTEVVANIKGRDEIMAMLLSLITFYFVLKYVNKANIKYLVIASITFLLALFSKENSITYLGVIPLGILLFSDKIPWKSILISQGVLLVSTFVFLIKRFQVLGFSFGESTLEMMNNPFVKVENGQYIPFEATEKIATILFSLGEYIRLLVYPHPLTHDYYPRHLGVMSFSDPFVLISILIYISFIGLIIYYWKKNPILSFGISSFIISLSIVSNIVFPVGTHMSERFLFMPGLGFSLIIGYFIFQLYHKKRNLAIGIFAILILGYSFKTILRNNDWYDNYTLFTTDIKVSHNSAKLQNSVGGELIKKASTTKDKVIKNKLITDAQKHLRQAIKIHPNYKNAYLLLGNSLLYQDKFVECINTYNTALKMDPNYPEALGNLAIAYRTYAKSLGEKGKVDEALPYLENANKLRPNDPEILRLLGVAYGSKGNHSKAILYFKKVTTLQPNNKNAWQNLAAGYRYLGDDEGMKNALEKAESLK